MKPELLIDDNIRIPQRILNMSIEELEKEIARLEEQSRVKREAQNHQSAVS